MLKRTTLQNLNFTISTPLSVKGIYTSDVKVIIKTEQRLKEQV